MPTWHSQGMNEAIGKGGIWWQCLDLGYRCWAMREVGSTYLWGQCYMHAGGKQRGKWPEGKISTWEGGATKVHISSWVLSVYVCFGWPLLLMAFKAKVSILSLILTTCSCSHMVPSTIPRSLHIMINVHHLEHSHVTIHPSIHSQTTNLSLSLFHHHS